MAFDTAAPQVSDDQVVCRVYELSRQGDTTTREFQLLDFVIQKRLQQTYAATSSAAALTPPEDRGTADGHAAAGAAVRKHPFENIHSKTSIRKRRGRSAADGIGASRFRR